MNDSGCTEVDSDPRDGRQQWEWTPWGLWPARSLGKPPASGPTRKGDPLMEATLAPFTWFGGKTFLAPKLLPLIPPHTTYVEVFGGAASLLHARTTPSPVEVYNDIDDEGLVTFWRVLQDRQQLEAFARRVALTPHSRVEFERARATWPSLTDPVERAAAWFVVARQSFSGDHFGGWSYARSETSSGMSRCTAKWLSGVDRLYEVHQRWIRVQVESKDFRELIPIYDSPDTFHYVDPPYSLSVRSRTGRYRHELSDADHRDLVEVLLGIQGMCMLSGYDNPIYGPLEAAGWERREFPTVAHAAGHTRRTGLLGPGASLVHQKRVEVVWLNPQACQRQVQLRLF